ncbi:hypothetical protein AURDEDRAFT_169764 [Auricularia subglabra TFB-10046 SS5]|nr:hypothetical protein AURDEDRAFT_169764 [Auricularia subglabra TFB-10046 SS5]
MTLAYLRHLKSLLVSADSAFADAEHRLRTCQQALDEAKIIFDLTEQEKRTLGRSRDGLRRAITEAQQTLQYSSLLPDEILSLIFVHAVAGTAATIPTATIDWTLARLPGALRLVCRRWNSVALATRELWTYIVVPARLEHVSRPGLPAYLSQQLERSGTLNLNVLIDAEFYYKDGRVFCDRRDAIFQQTEFLREAFDVLVTEATTARISMLAVTGSPPKLDAVYATRYRSREPNDIRHLTMGLLRLPTPALEEAYLLLEPEDSEGREPWDTSPPDHTSAYFPVAPKLRVLHMSFMPVICYPPHPGLPSLERLLFQFRVLYECHLVGMLSLCPSLRELASSVDSFKHDSLPGVQTPQTVALSANSLYIGWEACSSSFCQAVSLPNVTSLTIQPWRMFADDLHIQLAPTLTSLNFEEAEDLYPEDIDRLSIMTFVESFTLWTNDLDLDYLVGCLCRLDNPLWPRLKHIELGGSLGKKGGAELVRLARRRAVAQAGNASSQAVTVAALETIRVKEQEIANWVLVLLRTILGTERVVLEVGGR